MITEEGIEIRVGQVWENRYGRQMLITGWGPRKDRWDEVGTEIQILFLEDNQPSWIWIESFTNKPGDYQLIKDAL